LINKNTVESFLNQSKNGRTVYHTAALHGHLDVLNLLIVNSKDIKMFENDDHILKILKLKDNCGITPFMDALLADHVHIIQHFFETHNNVEDVIRTRDNIKNSCIHLVAQSGSVKCCEFIFDRFYLDVTVGDDFVSKFEKDLNIFKMTALHSACKVCIYFKLEL
jgi:ankyrin repeat protein